MKKYINNCSIYFLLWCLYYLQGALYTTGGGISKCILLILLLWSATIFVKVNTNSYTLPSFFKVVNIFLLLTTIYGLLLVSSGQELYIKENGPRFISSNHTYLKNIYISLLPIYVFYYYTKKRTLNNKFIIYFILCLLAINIINFFYQFKEQMMLADAHIDGVTLNIGYSFLALIPLLLLNNKPIIQYFLLIITIVFIIFSMKRGAVLIGAICFLYFIYTTIRDANGKMKTVALILSAVAILSMLFIIDNLLSSNDYFVHRIEETLEGDSSNRDTIYSDLFNHFISETNIFRLLFGNGANSTLRLASNFAHNDWLEIAINNGVIGLFVYLCYFIALLRDYSHIKRHNNLHSRIILMSFIILFLSSLFSMSYSSINIAISIALGYTLASNNSRRAL